MPKNIALVLHLVGLVSAFLAVEGFLTLRTRRQNLLTPSIIKQNGSANEQGDDKDSETTTTATVTPYSLGVHPYRSTRVINDKGEEGQDQRQRRGKKLRPVVKFFSESSSSTSPYTLGFQSNQVVATRRRKRRMETAETLFNDLEGDKEVHTSDDGGGVLEPRVVRFSVDKEAHQNSPDSSPSTRDAVHVLLPNNPLESLQEEADVNGSSGQAEIADYNKQQASSNLLVKTDLQLQQQRQPFLPIPFAPPGETNNRTSSTTSSTTTSSVYPISLAENLLQLAPKVVNDVKEVSSSTLTHNWDSSISLWNTSVVLAAEALQNMSSATSTNTASFAESLLQFLEQVGESPEIKNLTARLQAARTLNNSSTPTTPTFTSTPPSPAARSSAPVQSSILAANRTRVSFGGGRASPPKKKKKLPKKPSQQQPSAEPPAFDTGGKAKTDPLTLEDLEHILRANGYVRESELRAGGGMVAGAGLMADVVGDGTLEGVGKPVSAQQHALRTTPNSKNVAFPQPSVLSYNALKWGTAVSSGLCFMIASTALVPNLWLVGLLGGGFYGYDIGKQLPQIKMPKTLLPAVLVRLGTRLARTSLQIYDVIIALVFMWKTGVLSYEYWKKYAVLDQKFGIQSKIDAWNARFIEGKIQFDKWEQENEVGRKALATLRTIWLVEEKSLKKGLKNAASKQQPRRGRSKYRIIQLIYDLAYSTGRVVANVLNFLTGGGSTELTEFLRGIRLDISQARVEGIGARVGAVMAAWVAVNVLGAVFTLASPALLTLLATVLSVIWPTWIAELWQRLQQFLLETRAVGRGERPQASPAATLRSQRAQRQRFHFYVAPNGKKRYYRTGQIVWPWLKPKPEPKSGLFGFLQQQGN